MKKPKQKTGHAPVTALADPLFSRLDNAAGTFTVEAEDRYARIVMDVEVSSDMESAVGASVKHYARGISATEGDFAAVSLAVRPLHVGERTLGFDPEIKFFFGSFSGRADKGGPE